MGFYIVALREGEKAENVAGCSRQIIYHDLKTVRGVINRLRNWNVGMKREVYRFANVYDESSYRLVATF